MTRIFDGLETQINVYPEWLINPETNRRLKLDILCPEINIAVRFEGVQKKGQQKVRPSLEEEELQRVRDNARVEKCREHDIFLMTIDVAADTKTVFREMDVILSQAKQLLNDPDKKELISQSRSVVSTIARRVKAGRDLKIYADLWEDRQYEIAKPNKTGQPDVVSVPFTAGMDVNHAVFGVGTIVSIEPNRGDIILTVDFLEDGRKTLAASLVIDKLMPL